MVWDPDAAIAAMYPRLPSDVAPRLAERLRPGASPVGEYPLAEHPDVPTALIYAREDEFFTPEWERFAARRVLGIEPIEIPGGHFPMIESPDALRGAARRPRRRPPPLKPSSGLELETGLTLAQSGERARAAS